VEEKVSIVIPIYNEALNLPGLFERLAEALQQFTTPYEVIMVDDGSKDGSYQKILELAHGRPVTAIKLRRNFGQTAALAAGIERATGTIIVTLDSDLENDPRDIPKLLKKMEEGFDVVSGWRKNRWEGAFLTRKLPSITANWLISKMSGTKLHDYGCTLKAYRAEYLKGVQLYGQMHRFIPAYVAWQGGRVSELPVSYQPRMHGKSNYGTGRILRVLLDLVVIVFMYKYMNRPMHFFGGWGLWSILAGFLCGAVVMALRIFGIPNPIISLPVLAIFFVLVGIQFILFGVIAEMLMRTYYESQGRRPYLVGDIKEVA
jgi:glycosyltransferase involved in cell wall biosynthesis